MLKGEKVKVFINVFQDAQTADRVAASLRSKSGFRSKEGFQKPKMLVNEYQRIVMTEGRVLFIFKPEKGFVEPEQANAIISIVAQIPIEESVLVPPEAAAVPTPPVYPPAPFLSEPVLSEPVTSPNPDVLQQIEQLGRLQAQGILTESEFADKKAELLKRI